MLKLRSMNKYNSTQVGSPDLDTDTDLELKLSEARAKAAAEGRVAKEKRDAKFSYAAADQILAEAEKRAQQQHQQREGTRRSALAKIEEEELTTQAMRRRVELDSVELDQELIHLIEDLRAHQLSLMSEAAPDNSKLASLDAEITALLSRLTPNGIEILNDRELFALWKDRVTQHESLPSDVEPEKKLQSADDLRTFRRNLTDRVKQWIIEDDERMRKNRITQTVSIGRAAADEFRKQLAEKPTAEVVTQARKAADAYTTDARGRRIRETSNGAVQRLVAEVPVADILEGFEAAFKTLTTGVGPLPQETVFSENELPADMHVSFNPDALSVMDEDVAAIIELASLGDGQPSLSDPNNAIVVDADGIEVAPELRVFKGPLPALPRRPDGSRGS